MTHTINQKQWGEIVLVDYNEGLHKRELQRWHIHMQTCDACPPFRSRDFCHTVF